MKENEKSVLNFYKKLIKIKKSSETLIYGKYKLILENDENIYSYIRELSEEKYIIICNLSNNENQYIYEKEKLDFEGLILANYDVKLHSQITKINLKPWECRLYKIK